MKKQMQSKIRSKGYLTLLLLGIFAVSTYGQEFTVDGIKYKITSATAVEIVDYAVTGGHVEIPPTVNNGQNTYTVTAIGGEAFEDNKLTHVIIPNSVTSIGNEAFRKNNLRKVTIPNSVISIVGVSAFHFNPNLETITVRRNDPPTLDANAFHTPQSSDKPSRENIDLLVPIDAIGNYQGNTQWEGFKSINGFFIVGDMEYVITSTSPPEVRITDYNGTAAEVKISETVDHGNETYTVTAIGINAFRDKELTSIDIPNSVTSIRPGAFNTNQLASVEIPENVTTIGADAFRNNKLTSVTIPGSVTSIEQDAFQSNELGEVSFSTSSKLTSIEEGVFKSNQLTGVNIPNTVTSIGNSAFSTNQLTKVTIPGSVTSIDSLAFDGNPLNKVFVGAIYPPSLAANAFENRPQIDVFVTEGAQGVYENIWGTDFKSISPFLGQRFTVGDTEYAITSLSLAEVEVVSYTGSATEVEILKTVKDQDNIKYTVTAIGKGAFQQKGLTLVAIPNTVTSIGEDAFWENELTSVSIPESVTSLGQRAFGTNKLTEVIIPNKVTSIGQWVFAQNRLTEITIPANVESIGHQAFFGNTLPGLSLVTVERNDPPTTLNATAFEGRHHNVINVVVPPGKKQAYEDAGWTGFRSISERLYIGDIFSIDHFTYKVTSLDPGNEQVMVTDYNTAGSTGVFIPSTVDHGLETFKVTAIGNKAFEGKGLTHVTIPNTVTSIGDSTFRNNRLPHVTILSNMKSIGLNVFQGNPLLKTLKVEATDPPSLTTTNASANRNQIDLTVPTGKAQDYLDKGWTGFRSIISGTFTVDNFEYGITSTNEVQVVRYTGTAESLTILGEVNNGSETYTVTAIGNHAFFGNQQLKEVTIPDSVQSIGGHAFYNNPKLHRVTVLAIDPPTLSADAFQHEHRYKINVTVSSNETLRINDPDFGSDMQKIVKAYTDAGWTGFRSVSSLAGQHFDVDKLKYQVHSVSPDRAVVTIVDYHGPGGHLEIPATVVGLQGRSYAVENIGYHAFRVPPWGGPQLTSVVIPEGVRIIEDEAFVFNRLTSVEIPESVYRIGKSAFASNLINHVTLPDWLQGISAWTFYNNQLTEVTIPGSRSLNLRGINLYAFHTNPNLRLLTMEPTDPPYIHRSVFANANRDQIDLVVPMGAGRIQAYLDKGWTGFRSVTFGIFTVDGITYGITSPTEVMVVDYTGTGTEVEIPEEVNNGLETYTVATIREDAFWKKQLTSVDISDSVTSIGQRAFGDNQLTEVTLPGSVERIAFQAFSNNPDLGLVTVETNDPSALDAAAFTNANRFQIDLVVPTGRIQAYKDNGWDGFRSISDGSSTPPQPAIDAPQSVDNLEPFIVNITFDGEVTDFGLDDIQVANATVTDFTGSGSTYAATLTPTSLCDGNITIDVPANVATGVNSLSNQAATQVIVAVVDTIDPTITCPADVMVNAADIGTGDCTTTVDLGSPVTDDNCSVAAVVAQVNGTEIDPGTYAFGAGTTTVTWIVSDGSGNTASCEQTVTVEAAGDCESATFTIDAIADVTLQENTVYTSVTPVLSGDDPKGTVTWTLGGTDAENFSIDGSTGVVTMIARDFEAPADANADNIYEVSITATDSESNSGETSWTVTVEDDPSEIPPQVPSSSPMIPTAFTPNGDGANDTWIIDDLSEDASVKIYDRNGTIIFSSDDGYTRPWDGTSRGGSLPAGSYLYLIQNGPHKYKGTVTILL